VFGALCGKDASVLGEGGGEGGRSIAWVGKEAARVRNGATVEEDAGVGEGVVRAEVASREQLSMGALATSVTGGRGPGGRERAMRKVNA